MKKVLGKLIFTILAGLLCLAMFYGYLNRKYQACLSKQYHVSAVRVPYCRPNLIDIRQGSIGYYGEYNMWPTNLTMMNFKPWKDSSYTNEILQSDHNGYVAACYSNLDGDDALDIWITSNTTDNILHISDDCSDKGSISVPGNWKEEAIILISTQQGVVADGSRLHFGPTVTK